MRLPVWCRNAAHNFLNVEPLPKVLKGSLTALTSNPGLAMAARTTSCCGRRHVPEREGLSGEVVVHACDALQPPARAATGSTSVDRVVDPVDIVKERDGLVDVRHVLARVDAHALAFGLRVGDGGTENEVDKGSILALALPSGLMKPVPAEASEGSLTP